MKNSKFIPLYAILPSLIMLLICSINIVNSDEIGVKTTLGKIDASPLPSGLHIKLPIISTIHTLSLSVQTLTEDAKVLSKDNLTLDVECTVQWGIDTEKAPTLYVSYNSLENITANLVRPVVLSELRTVISSSSWENIAANRVVMENNLSEQLSRRLLAKGIVVTSALISNITPPESIKEAVAKKLKAQQEVQEKVFEKQKAQQESDIKVIEAQGIARSEHIINDKLTPLYVQWYNIKTLGQLATSNGSKVVILPYNSSKQIMLNTGG